MSLTVAPSASFIDDLAPATSGLVGTIQVGIYQGDTVIQDLTTSGINEIGTTGVYIATMTAPSTTGQYTIIWSLDGTLSPDQVTPSELTVTGDLSAGVIGSGNLYVTLTELKSTLNITTTTWDADLTAALGAACRGIDQECGRRFYADADATSIRYFTPGAADALIIDDLATLGSVAIDSGGTGTFGTTWTQGTHFDLTPYNAAADGWPYTGIELRSSASMPSYRRSVRVTGQFGWPAVPATIAEATAILAGRLFKRMREAPLGVYGFGVDGSTVRISRTDPDVCSLVEPYSRRRMIL